MKTVFVGAVEDLSRSGWCRFAQRAMRLIWS